MLASSLTDLSISQVPQQDAGSASGVLNMMQQVGSSIGIAILGTIFSILLEVHLKSVDLPSA